MASQPAAIAAQRVTALEPASIPELRVRELSRIGGYDDRPAYALSSVPGAAVVLGGEIAVIDRLAREIRVFAVDGTHARTIGRQGEGPGEFESLRAIQALPGGRIAAWDQQAFRLTTFDRDGAVLRTASVPRDHFSVLWATWAGAFPDGSFVLRHTPDVSALRREPEGWRRDPYRFVLVSAAGEALRTVWEGEGPEKCLYHQDRSWGLEDRIFEREVVGAVLAEHVLVARTDSLSFRRFTARGDPLDTWSFQRPPRPVGTREIEAERARRIEEVSAQRERGARALAGAGAPFAPVDFSELELDRLERVGSYPTLPAFRRVVAGSDGRLWVEDYPLPRDDSVRWYVISGGEPAGWVGLDASERLLAVGHGVMVSRVEDELGVQTVIVRDVEVGN